MRLEFYPDSSEYQYIQHNNIQVSIGRGLT